MNALRHLVRTIGQERGILDRELLGLIFVLLVFYSRGQFLHLDGLLWNNHRADAAILESISSRNRLSALRNLCLAFTCDPSTVFHRKFWGALRILVLR